MAQKAIAFGNHDKSNIPNPYEKSYPCVFCDQPVYISNYGGVYTDEPKETVVPEWDTIDVWIAKECFADIVGKFLETMPKMQLPKHV